MPIPVDIPVGQRVISDASNVLVENFVAAIAQVFRYGTTGAAINTPPTLYPDGDNPAIDPFTGRPQLTPLVIDTPEKQLYYRQLAVALVTALSAGAAGVSPTEVSVTPGAGLIPRADSEGHLDLGWITSALDVLSTFIGECPNTTLVGDLVYVSGSTRSVALADFTDADKLPSIGCVTAKFDPITCKVQTTGLVAGVYSGLLPGATYYLGDTGRPVAGVPAPDPGQALFQQAVGVALDPTTMILSPSTLLVRVRG